MKIKLFFPILFLLFLFSCNLDKEEQLSEEQIKELKKNHDDSIMLVLDSLYKIDIYVPPLYDKMTFDSATTINFFELAKATHGELKLLVNAGLITNEIINIINTHAQDNSDLLFLIDKTGSMQDDILNVKKGLSQIIDALNKYQNIRLGIALYGDKNVDGSDWFSFKNFETDHTGAKKFIQNINVTNGDDYPESVYDGFFKSNEQDFWRSENKRMIILIGDAPPLEKPLSDFTLSDVIGKANEYKIKMNFYPIVVTPYVNSLLPEGSVKTYAKEKIISSLYPNPSAGPLTVNFERSDNYLVEVFNSAGEIILSEEYSGDQWKGDLSEKEKGAYILRAISKDKNYETAKFIINK